MTSKQRDHLHHLLEAKRVALLHDLEHLEQEAAEEGAVDSVEVEDIAEGVIEDRTRATLEERDRELLQEVELALAKMREDRYGLSEKSGRPIPFKRLEQVPWARYDAEEAELLERRW